MRGRVGSNLHVVEWRGAARALALACLVALVPARHAGADGDPDQGPGPLEVVREITHDFAVAVAKDGEALRADDALAMRLVEKVLGRHADFEFMSQLVVGRSWSQVPADKRTRFVEEFRFRLLRTYGLGVVEYADAQIDYEPLRMGNDGRSSLVRTRLQPATGPRLRIDYRLRLRDGAWRLFDVAVDGQSLVALYRQDFAALMSSAGIDGLIATLEEKNRPYRNRL